MGLADEFFWNLTPRLFDLLADQYRQHERRLNLRAGLIAAELRNSNRSKRTDKVWTPIDFFPEAASRDDAQTEEEMLMAMNAWVTRTKGMNRC